MTAEPAARNRRIDLAGGIVLHCLQWEGSGLAAQTPVPLLLVHGLASNCRTWEAVATMLAARGHPVAAVDLRGHGLSDAPDAGYDFATLCDDLERVLDALGYDKAVVVGQSTGGNVAVELALRTGHRLAGAGAVDGGTLELRERWPRWEDCAVALAPPDMAGTPATDMAALIRRDHPDWDEWGINATLANLEVLDDGTVRARLRRVHHMLLLRALWEHRPSTVLAHVAVPVLLVMADSGDAWSTDKLATTDRAADLLQRGRVHVVERADHDIHVQQPQTVAGLLLEALEDGFFDL